MTGDDRSLPPWKRLPQHMVLNPGLTLRDLGAHWKVWGTKNGETGKCRNCWQIQKIKHLGLCTDCYIATINVTGDKLLSALLHIRALFHHNVDGNDFKRPLSISPIIKKSIVIEFGDAEMEFRINNNLLDIKVEDAGDLIFFARGVDASILRSLTSLQGSE